jgi:hypothetical protein
MSSIKVLYVIQEIEHESASLWPELLSFHCFLTEAAANKFIAEEDASEIVLSALGHTTFSTYEKIGYREACAARLSEVKTDHDKRIWVQRVNDLLTPSS